MMRRESKSRVCNHDPHHSLHPFRCSQCNRYFHRFWLATQHRKKHEHQYYKFWKTERQYHMLRGKKKTRLDTLCEEMMSYQLRRPSDHRVTSNGNGNDTQNDKDVDGRKRFEGTRKESDKTLSTNSARTECPPVMRATVIRCIGKNETGQPGGSGFKLFQPWTRDNNDKDQHEIKYKTVTCQNCSRTYSAAIKHSTHSTYHSSDSATGSFLCEQCSKRVTQSSCERANEVKDTSNNDGPQDGLLKCHVGSKRSLGQEGQLSVHKKTKSETISGVTKCDCAISAVTKCDCAIPAMTKCDCAISGMTKCDCAISAVTKCDSAIPAVTKCDCVIPAVPKHICAIPAVTKCNCTISALTKCDCEISAGIKCDCGISAGTKCDCAISAGTKCDCKFSAVTKHDCTISGDCEKKDTVQSIIHDTKGADLTTTTDVDFAVEPKISSIRKSGFESDKCSTPLDVADSKLRESIQTIQIPSVAGIADAAIEQELLKFYRDAIRHIGLMVYKEQENELYGRNLSQIGLYNNAGRMSNRAKEQKRL